MSEIESQIRKETGSSTALTCVELEGVSAATADGPPRGSRNLLPNMPSPVYHTRHFGGTIQNIHTFLMISGPYGGGEATVRRDTCLAWKPTVDQSERMRITGIVEETMAQYISEAVNRRPRID